MKSDNRPYLFPVDHLRAFAVVLVLVYHSIQLISQAADPATGWQPDRWLHTDNPVLALLLEGHTGVALFLVLSGFIFTTGTLDKDVAYWPFLRNRLLRVYPLYLTVLLVGAASTDAPFDLGTFLRALLPIANFGPVGIGGVWGAMFWAVGVELQFYVIFPLLLRLLQRSGPTALLRLIAALAVLRSLAWAVSPDQVDLTELTYFSLVGRLDQFLLGMLAGWWYLRGPRTRSAVLALVGGVVAVFGLALVANHETVFLSTSWWRVFWVDVEGLTWAAVIVGAVVLFRSRRGRVSTALAAVGERSYSAYLLHFVIITIVAAHEGWWVRVGGPVATALATGVLVVLPAVLLLSWLTYAAIERPFLAMRGQYVRPRPEA
ncbi:acyltransferase [Cellulomonas sp. NPDC089187]|uniref:acyltransferase family protein n=1 Tax=Cellulomonas sp. NPDC089187 TaxID=3154970 RepID=UPI00341CFA4E